MTTKDCFLLGRFGKTLGHKGEINLKLDVDNPSDYHQMESVFALLGGKLIPFFFTSIRPGTKDRVVVKIEDLDTHTDAQRLVGAHAYLPLNALPPTEGDSFYLHDAIGAEILDSEYGVVGKVKSIIDTGVHSFFEAEHNSKIYLIPIVDEIVLSLDQENNLLKVNLPEGLIDL